MLFRPQHIKALVQHLHRTREDRQWRKIVQDSCESAALWPWVRRSWNARSRCVASRGSCRKWLQGSAE